MQEYEATHGRDFKSFHFYRNRNATRVIGNILHVVLKDIKQGQDNNNLIALSHAKYGEMITELEEALKHLEG